VRCGICSVGEIFATAVAIAFLGEGFDASAIELSPRAIASTLLHEVVWPFVSLMLSSTKQDNMFSISKQLDSTSPSI
jgi:hypothetical protein